MVRIHLTNPGPLQVAIPILVQQLGTDPAPTVRPTGLAVNHHGIVAHDASPDRSDPELSTASEY